jgi:polyisoprenoid-binding protein YceI
MSVSTENVGLSATTGTWAIDPTHTTIGFSVRHAMVSKVRGNFSDFAGSTTIDGANLAASSVEVTIQAGSIDTKNADRDGHLVSADFLDVENFPTLTFTSTNVAVNGADVTITGDLTIHGVTRSVTVEFEYIGTSLDPFGFTRVGFEGTAKISRKDFGLVWNAALETGGVLVGDEITLVLDVEAVKQA